MIKINSFEDLHKYSPFIPVAVLVDINKRISDWLASGGNINDSYILQQFRYAENIVNKIVEVKDANFNISERK